jgi:alkylation response protein AidB-like acyl-CoA dehydrogenase
METPQGYDSALWTKLVEIGVVGLLINPEYGGTGLGPVELEPVMEETGAALLCSPLLSSGVLATGLLSASGDKEAQARLLHAIANGTTIATVAVTGDAGTWTPEGVTVDAQPTDGSAVLNGVASYVTHGQIANLLLVVAKVGTGLGIFEVAADAAGLAKSALPSFDKTLRLARLEFANTRARQIGQMGWPAVQSALDLALVAMASEQAGGGRRIFDLTIEYAKTAFSSVARSVASKHSSTWPPTY